MIKIAFVIDTIESPTAGTEKQLLLLIKHLDRTKFQPYLAVLRTSEWLAKEFDLCPLFEAKIESFKTLNGWLGLKRLAGFFATEHIDIVQTHFRDSSIAGILAARLAGVTAIVATRRNQGYWLTPMELRIQTFLNRWVTAFIANSVSTKQWAETTEGISSERVHVIYNAIDLEPYKGTLKEMRAAARHELNLAENVPVVGIVANLRPVKGIDLFLRAASYVSAIMPAARFLIVGEGNERAELEELANTLGLGEAVSFLGSRQNVIKLLAAFDVGVLSSNSESFSNSIVEYLAAGLPVVCTDVGGCREAVEGDGRGIVVAVGDHEGLGKAIIRLLEQPDSNPHRGSSAWVSKTCDLKQVVDKFEGLYAGLIKA